MQVRFDHETTRAKARTKVEEMLDQVQKQYGHFLSDVDYSWGGDILTFAFNARGMKVKGTVEVTDTEVILEGHLPLMAKPFEPKIAKMIEGEAKNVFRTA